MATVEGFNQVRAEGRSLHELHRVHLIGIGGMALSAIAAVLIERGHSVSGSDLQASAYTDKLRQMGAQIRIGHAAANVDGADAVVYSAAVPPDNPERLRAAELGLPEIRRAEIIGRLMDERWGIAVAGTHGKTTTTAMIAFVLQRAGLAPGYLVGAAVEDLGGNGHWGTGRPFVVEADEYDSAFLEYRPELALITHLEPDHLDYFGSTDRMVHEFQIFVRGIRPGGALIARSGVPLAREAAAAAQRVIWFGDEGEWSLRRFEAKGWGATFQVHGPCGVSAEAVLQVPGRHNAYNALAAIAAAAQLGVPAQAAADHLAAFRGAERRFRLAAEGRGITVVDDYAHHPTKVRAALAAAKGIGAERVWAVFQPHLRSRTQDLFDDFAASFGDADRVTIAEIFSPPGREDESRVTGRDLASAIRGVEASFQPSIEQCFQEVANSARSGDLILVMGAGDINRLSEMIAEWLRA